jgi:type III pantothenate kinase
MILAIDSGNTHTTFGCVYDDNSVGNIFRLTTDISETEFGYATKIKQIFDLYGVKPENFSGAVLSSVVPPMTNILKNAVKLFSGLDTLVVGAGVKTGLHLCINDPGTVASDLVSAAVGAKEEYPLPCIVIDLGTATTFTVVDEKGRYVGGAILPGVGISLTSLSEKTALLPKIEITEPKNTIGTNTIDCMKSGIIYGTAGAIDGMLSRIEKELPCPVASIVATGGYSSIITPHCEHNIAVDETLLLKGLGIIFKRNQKN